MAHYIANERLYLDKEGNVVKEDDPNRHRLLVGAGGRLPIEEAERLGLTKGMTREESPRITAKAESAPKATKAKAKADDTKSDK